MTTFSKTDSARQAVTLTGRRGGAILLAGLAAAVVFISCDDMLPDDAAMVGAEAADEVVFAAGGPAFSAVVSTKASVVSSLPSFHVACTQGGAGSETSVWENTVFVSDGAPAPTYRGGRFWPVNDPGYHFFASNAPLSFGADGTAATVDGSTDVVCAYMPNPAYKVKNTLSFEHIFARIGKVTVSAGPDYSISAVSISLTPKVSGTYDLAAGAGKSDGTGWSALVDGSATVLASPASIATGGHVDTANDVYLVPGKYTISATWTATRGNYTETFTGMTQEIDIVGGKVNNISTTLVGKATEVEFGVEIAPWGSNEVEVDFPLVYDPSKGHSYVDLGLRKTVDGTVYKVLFADRNVGASAPEDQGDYYAFGETTKSSGTRSGKDYNWENCPFHTGTESHTGWSKYIPTGKESYSVSGTTDNKLVLDKCDDAASASWGGAWRTPSPEEFCMLLNGDGTDWAQDKLSVVSYHWVDNYNGSGVNGLLVQGTGLFSSSSVFLPACGYCEGRGVTAMDSGEYWTREILSHSPEFAVSFSFINDSQVTDYGSRRFEGRQIRPVLVLPD